MRVSGPEDAWPRFRRAQHACCIPWVASLNAFALVFLLPWLDVVLLAVALATQAALALALFLRRPGREWQYALAGHLTVNALGASLDLANVVWPLTRFVHDVSPLLNFLTAVFILYLALAYPARPRWLARRWWHLPILVGLLAAAFLVAWLSGVNLENGLHDSQDWLGRFFANAFPALAWVALLSRWTPLLLRQESPVLRRQFTFIYGAYAVRAAHVALLVPLLAVQRWAPGVNSSYVWLALPALGLLLLTLLWSLAALLQAAARLAGARRTAVLWALGFLCFGVIEPLLSDAQALHAPFGTTALVDVDVVVIRPLLLWLALFHFEAAGPSMLRSKAALAAAVTLTAIVVWVGLDASLQGSVETEWLRLLLSGLIATCVTSLAAAILAPRLLAPLPKGSLPPTRSADSVAMESFLARAEEEYRHGPPGPEGQRRLAAHAQRLGLEAGQARVLEAVVASGWAAGSGPWMPGQLLKGRYRLRQALGQGAWGETWSADDEWERLAVVMKRTGRLDDRGRRAILAEWEALRGLLHPNVVRLLGVVHLGRENVLVFPHHPKSLLDLIAEGKTPPHVVVQILRDMVAGLAAVHAEGLAHGDIKPSNVLLDSRGRAVLADFGSTHPLPGLVDSTIEPASGGTLSYMAPEQARGAPGDARSDVYSAALVACALLAGQNPHPDGLHPDELRTRVLSGHSAPWPAQTPKHLATALGKALQPNPRRRFSTAAAFLGALEGHPQEKDASTDLKQISRRKGFDGASSKS